MPTCHEWPVVMLFFGSLAACYMIAKWSRAEPTSNERWRWGDPPRRPRGFDPLCAASFIAGALGAVYAISYAVNHPLCG